MFCVLCPFVAGAQDLSVLYTRPASPEGRMLSIEEITTGKGVRPSMRRYDWQDENTYFYNDYRSCHSFNVADGAETVTDFKESVLPDDAENRTPAGGMVAYTSGSGLYVCSEDGQNTLFSVEGGADIVYGQSVSRNEFGIDGGIFWSPDASRLAFFRKDESLVTDFPLLDIKTRTGELMNIKYPMNGMASERIWLGVHDFASGSTTYIVPDDFGEDRYLTNISWDPSSSHIFIQVLDRTQHHMRLNMYSAADGSFVKTILTEDNEAWVEPYAPLHFIDESSFIYSTDNRDGYKSLYLCDLDGNVRRITGCDADVEFAAFGGGYLYYTSAEVSPVENHLFRVKLTPARKGGIMRMRIGEPERLTPAHGWHNVAVSPDCSHFVDSYSAFDVPFVAELRRCDGRLVRREFASEEKLDAFATGEVRLGTVKSADGRFDNYYRLFLPLGFDPQKQYPLIVYVYGGPHSQMVQDSWLAGVRMLELYWAQRGYVVYVQDNRGTSNRGTEFEKAINRNCGQAEMADQMAGIGKLLEQPWIDKERVGVHGWSYGGFMTISLMTNYPEVFKVGVAGGPVIDWKWYEIMYGERYMDTMETNPEGFERTSLMNRTSDLKGKLLICQGAIDNTVVWEHSLSFVQKCIEEGVQLDYFPYPCTEHNVALKWRAHLNQKIVNYFEDYL